jgi:hypothetical protein
MRALKTLAVSAVLLLAAGAAQAQPAGKVHFANVLINPVQFSVGAAPARSVPGGQWVLYDTASGTHKVTVRLANGQELSRTGQFDNADLTTFGKGRYWCVAVVGDSDTSDDNPLLLLLDPDQCKRVLEAGEPID